MTRSFDVIVIGLGGMGSAAAYHLASRGQRVLGLERFTPAHDRGSSHGGSRITRLAYFEDPAYVPLLLRSHELWRELERESGAEILTITGGLMLGPESSRTIAGSVESARRWNLPHEMLDSAEIHRRFPTFTPGPGVIALYEADDGFVRPEISVQTHIDLARHKGADLRFEEPVQTWDAAASGDRVQVTTDRGTYEAGRLVIAPGAWAPELLTGLGLPMSVERYVQFFFRPVSGVEPFLAERHPIYIWEAEDTQQFYGFPAHDPVDAGVKVAFFRIGSPASPEDLDREVHPDEVALMRTYLDGRIPQLNGEFLRGVPCMYTNTPDEHFVIATHPAHPQVAIAAGFSGHGFKFVPVVGEILADLATTGSTDHPIALFNPARFRG
jgi:sarcosine oxidase